jgi:hypothetical protein
MPDFGLRDGQCSNETGSKKGFILFIHPLQCVHLQSTSLAPAHTLSSGATIVLAYLERILWGCVTDLWMFSVDPKWCPFNDV